jgi:hypothetical protein
VLTKAIPTEANGSTGNNTSFYSNPERDKLMLEVDNNLDDNVRKEAAAKADRILADDMVCVAARPATRHRDLEQQAGRPDLGQPDRGHVLEYRRVGTQEVTSGRWQAADPW